MLHALAAGKTEQTLLTQINELKLQEAVLHLLKGMRSSEMTDLGGNVPVWPWRLVGAFRGRRALIDGEELFCIIIINVKYLVLLHLSHQSWAVSGMSKLGVISVRFPGHVGREFCPIITSQRGTLVRTGVFTICFDPCVEKGSRMALESQKEAETLGRWTANSAFPQAALLCVPDPPPRLVLSWFRENRVRPGTRNFVQGCCSTR